VVRALGGALIVVTFEEDVLNRLLSCLDPTQVHEPRPDDETEAALAELARLEERKKQVTELGGPAEMDITEFRAAKAANDRKIEALRQVLTRSAEEEAPERARAEAEALDLWAKWDDLDVENRRRVVGAVTERVQVRPAELLLARAGEVVLSPRRAGRVVEDRLPVSYAQSGQLVNLAGRPGRPCGTAGDLGLNLWYSFMRRNCA
jgi:hypothetical protein